MPTNKKIDIVSDLTKKLSAAKCVVFADYRGLKTSQIEDLRQKIEEAGGNLMITKNTLLRLALEKTTYHLPLTTHQLEGPTATLFSFTDEITPIKTLVKFAKDWELPTIKFGFLGKNLINAEKINELAKLPSRNELLAQLIGQVQTPTYGLVSGLGNNLRKLVYLMQAVSEQKANQGGDKDG